MYTSDKTGRLLILSDNICNYIWQWLLLQLFLPCQSVRYVLDNFYPVFLAIHQICLIMILSLSGFSQMSPMITLPPSKALYFHCD